MHMSAEQIIKEDVSAVDVVGIETWAPAWSGPVRIQVPPELLPQR